MFVTRYMTPAPLTVSPETPVPEARKILKEKHFRHLPVTDPEGHLLGIVTDRDIRSVYPSSILRGEERQRILEKVESSTVDNIMSTRLSSLNLNSTIDDALILLEKQNVGALPVLDDDGKVIGIFSIRDLMRAYGELFGLYEKGNALVSVRDTGENDISRLVNILEKRNIPFTRVIRSRDTATGSGDESTIHIRVQTMQLSSIKKALREEGFEVI
ncbi:MAG: acetoin utilization protein AcuB [Thermodesulfatator sp.]|nr:MAG: acetoin utilization protein AcuB [Thermodesulfatator sp.]